ncbi:MAG TPA: Crp/Fnr family transcriptional regulator [Thermoanaerobaculaceae bacterium]|nr:Crp/Fnr family transcriptional regulator [Thermoanaerobaculaceae bacterium]
MKKPQTPPSDATMTELLRGTPFGTLGEAALAGVARLFVRRRVARGALVFLEGDAGDRFFLLAAGRLKAFRRTASARDITVFTLGRGEFFGFLPLLDGAPYPLSVAALTQADLLVLHRPDFLRFVHDHPAFCLALVADLARRLRSCLDQVESLGLQGATSRAAHGLASLIPPGAAPGDAVEVTLPFTQAEFAQLLHITPENLSRALTRLRRHAVIERLGRGRFRIADVAALVDLAEGR